MIYNYLNLIQINFQITPNFSWNIFQLCKTFKSLFLKDLEKIFQEFKSRTFLPKALL